MINQTTAGFPPNPTPEFSSAMPRNSAVVFLWILAAYINSLDRNKNKLKTLKIKLYFELQLQLSISDAM